MSWVNYSLLSVDYIILDVLGQLLLLLVDYIILDVLGKSLSGVA